MAARKKKRGLNLERLQEANEQKIRQDEQIDAKRELEKAHRMLLPVESVQLRASDTRPLNQTHVKSLSDSIAALGLIQPIVVDRSNQLIAGGHRLAAIALLKADNPESFLLHFSQGVPVAKVSFLATEKPQAALELEIAENEKRLDYSKAEALSIAKRLQEEGYSFEVGRPKKGEKRVLKELSVLVGKSERTVRRWLSEGDAPRVPRTLDDDLKDVLRSARKYIKNSPEETPLTKLLSQVVIKASETSKGQS